MSITRNWETKAEKQAIRIWDPIKFPIPVDVKRLAESLGVQVLYEELEEDVSGMMVTREDLSVVILVNQKHHEHRKRFTIAHELGHYLLHRAISPVFVDSKKVFYRNSVASTGEEKQEIEANSFAAELLMPFQEIQKLVPSTISPMDNMDDIEDLARNYFGVSPLALNYRLARFGLLETAQSSKGD